MTRILSILLLLPFLCLAQNTEVGPIGNTPQKIDTLAGLVGRPGTNSQMLVVLGHSAVGDWGAQRNAVFDAGSTESTNLGCVFDAPGGRWKFPDCETGELKAEWFGAVGVPLEFNNVLPDAVGTNSTAAIQSATDYLADNGGGVVLFKTGTYWITNSIYVKPLVRYRGATPNNSFDGYVRTATGVSSGLSGATVIDGMANDALQSGFPLFVLDGSANYTSQFNASFVNVEGETITYYSGGNGFENIVFTCYRWGWGKEGQGPVSGILIDEVAGVSIKRCGFFHIGGVGIYAHAAQALVVDECTALNCIIAGLVMDYTSDTRVVNSQFGSQPVIYHKANTHVIQNSEIWNPQGSVMVSRRTGVTNTTYGITRTWATFDTYYTDASNETITSLGLLPGGGKFGADTGTPFEFYGSNLPAPFETRRTYFAVNGPTTNTIRVATSVKNALANTYIDITDTSTNGTWGVRSYEDVLAGIACEELLVDGNRMEQSWKRSLYFRDCIRTTIRGNSIWEIGTQQGPGRSPVYFGDREFYGIFLDGCVQTIANDNLLEGGYSFGLNPANLWGTYIGIYSTNSIGLTASGNSFSRLKYGIYADVGSLDVREENSSVGADVYKTQGGAGQTAFGPSVDPVFDNYIIGTIPDALTNLTTFTLRMSFMPGSPFYVGGVSTNDHYSPLFTLGPMTNVFDTPYDSVHATLYKNSASTNWNLLVSLAGTSVGFGLDNTNYLRQGFSYNIPEMVAYNQPMELVITRTNGAVAAWVSGVYSVLPLSLSSGSGADTNATLAKYFTLGRWDKLTRRSGDIWDVALSTDWYDYQQIRDGKHRALTTNTIFAWDFKKVTNSVVPDLSGNNVVGIPMNLGGGTNVAFGNVKLVEDEPPTGTYVRQNRLWKNLTDVDGSGSGLDADLLDGVDSTGYATSGHTHAYLPLAGGAMVGPVTSSSTWQGISFTGSNFLGTNFTGSVFTARGTSSGLIMYGRSTVTNFWNLYTGASNMIWYYNPGTGGGYNPFIFYTNGAITTLQGTVWNSGNDGSGSTLDADLLDGLHASSFLQDAPSDGSVYGRSNATWAVVSSGTSYSFTNGLTNSANVVSWSAVPGSNISFATNNGQITIDALTVGTNSGTPVSVDGGATLTAANFTDTARVNFTASGTNVSADLISASISTNYIDSTFHGLLTAADLVGSGTNIFVNAALVSLANLQDDTGAGGINWAVSGSNIKAYATNVAQFTNGLTNSAGVVSWAAAPGGNISFTTNNGQITIAALTVGTNSGTAVSVDGAASLAAANLTDSLELNPTASGSNVTYAIVVNSIDTNKLSTNAFIQLINRANHFGTQPWSTIVSTPTTLGGYGITDAQLTNTTLTRLGGIGSGVSGDIIYRDATGWTNRAKGADGQVLKLSSGLPIWDTDSTGTGGSSTNILVNGTLITQANLTDGNTVAFAVSGSTITPYVTNKYVSDEYAGGYLPLYAGSNNRLTGDLHYKQSSDIRSIAWESDTEWNSMGWRVNNGVWAVAEYNTNDFTVLESFIKVDPTDTVGPTDIITFLNEGFNNEVVFEPPVTFSGTISIDEMLYSNTNLYDDLMYYVSELNPVGVGTPPDIVATSGQDGEALAAVYNANDTLIINAQLPHTWSTGTVVYPHLHIEPQTTGAITNTWRVKHSVADIGGTFPTWTIVTNTFTIAAGNQWVHQLVGLPTGGIDMTGKVGPSTMLRIRAECISVNVNTYVLAADLHYQVRGSPVAYTP